MLGHMKDPVDGTATVVSYEAFTEPGFENDTRPGFEVTLTAEVVVSAEGLQPTAVQLITNFPQSELPLGAGATLPVIVDRKNPKHVKLNPDFAKHAKQAAKEAVDRAGQAAHDQAQQLAESLRAGQASGAPTTGQQPGPEASSVPMQVMGVDLAQSAALVAQVRQMLGANADAVAQVSGPSANTAEGQASADDPISKLERLSKLRDAGVLTDAEFEQQKQRLLGSS
jgi:hypothetical protein